MNLSTEYVSKSTFRSSILKNRITPSRTRWKRNSIIGFKETFPHCDTQTGTGRGKRSPKNLPHSQSRNNQKSFWTTGIPFGTIFEPNGVRLMGSGHPLIYPRGNLRSVLAVPGIPPCTTGQSWQSRLIVFTPEFGCLRGTETSITWVQWV